MLQQDGSINQTLKIMFNLSLFVLSLLSTVSCNNDDDNNSDNLIDQLPPATKTGENTFGCLINGVPFSITSSSQIGAVYQGGLLQLSATFEEGSIDETVAFNLIDPLSENQAYAFDNNSYRAGYSLLSNGNVCIYDFDDTIDGSIIFTRIDTENFIISGTFEFTTVTNTCETINITNGRFDLQYIP